MLSLSDINLTDLHTLRRQISTPITCLFNYKYSFISLILQTPQGPSLSRKLRGAHDESIKVGGLIGNVHKKILCLGTWSSDSKYKGQTKPAQ